MNGEPIEHVFTRWAVGVLTILGGAGIVANVDMFAEIRALSATVALNQVTISDLDRRMEQCERNMRSNKDAALKQ